MKKLTIILSSFIFISNVQAALFEDAEARRYLKDMEAKYEQKFKDLEQKTDRNVTQHINLLKEIDKKNEEISRLTGEIEVIQHNLEQLKKSQKEFFTTLDNRVLTIENVKTQEENKLKEEINARNIEFENNLNKFKEQKFKEASWGFASFINKNPNNQLTGDAQFWLANSFYALKEYKKAIEAYNKFIENYPQNEKISDAMLSLAFAYLETKNLKNNETTLKQIVSKYPDSEAGKEASKILKEMKQKPKTKK